MTPRPKSHEVIDALLPVVLTKTAELGNPVTCRGRGCFACCKEPVTVTEWEVDYMLEALSDEERRDLARRVAAALRKVLPSGLLKARLPRADQWRPLNVYCPFLVEGACSVYERRPRECRTFLAIRDPDFCHDDALRSRQRFCEVPELYGLVLDADARQHHEAGRAILMDNMLVFLAKKLLSREIVSGNTTLLIPKPETQTIKQTPVGGASDVLRLRAHEAEPDAAEARRAHQQDVSVMQGRAHPPDQPQTNRR